MESSTLILGVRSILDAKVRQFSRLFRRRLQDALLVLGAVGVEAALAWDRKRRRLVENNDPALTISSNYYYLLSRNRIRTRDVMIKETQ